MKKLLLEYKQSRRDLYKMLHSLGNSDHDNNDRQLINSMINSVSKIIDWLETGRNPYFQQGVDVRNAYDMSYMPNMDLLPDLQGELRKEREPLQVTDEHIEIFKKVISTLSDREWECFLMHEGLNKSMGSIANELGISKATVQTHIKRARNKIKKLAMSYERHTN